MKSKLSIGGLGVSVGALLARQSRSFAGEQTFDIQASKSRDTGQGGCAEREGGPDSPSGIIRSHGNDTEKIGVAHAQGRHAQVERY